MIGNSNALMSGIDGSSSGAANIAIYKIPYMLTDNLGARLCSIYTYAESIGDDHNVSLALSIAVGELVKSTESVQYTSYFDPPFPVCVSGNSVDGVNIDTGTNLSAMLIPDTAVTVFQYHDFADPLGDTEATSFHTTYSIDAVTDGITRAIITFSTTETFSTAQAAADRKALLDELIPMFETAEQDEGKLEAVGIQVTTPAIYTAAIASV